MGWLSEPLGLVLVGLITVVGTWLTNRAANRSTRHVTEQTVAAQVESSRVVAEEQAFQRAKGFYEGVIDRQDREIKGLEEDVERLKGQIAAMDRELSKARIDLSVCKRTLRRIRPDATDLD